MPPLKNIKQHIFYRKFILYFQCLAAVDDSIMVELCRRIASEDELRNVSIKGLKIPEYEVQTALTNHPKDIRSATSDIMRT